MRKLLAMILALVLTAGCALAEGPKAPDYILEGFDGENSGVIWETNLFFTRMQEKTGISFWLFVRNCRTRLNGWIPGIVISSHRRCRLGKGGWIN